MGDNMTTSTRRPSTPDKIKAVVADCLLSVNVKMDGPFIPPVAIDWIANDVVAALLKRVLCIVWDDDDDEVPCPECCAEEQSYCAIQLLDPEERKDSE